MKMHLVVVVVVGLALVGCDGSALLEEIETVEDLRNACEARTPEDVELEVSFPNPDRMCPFGEEDNLERNNGVMTARIEQFATVELPEGGLACDMEFDFQGIDPSTEQIMQYDDHFVLAFNDVVLASNNKQIADEFAADDDGLRLYEWEDLVGLEFDFFGLENYCLGEETDGLSECVIPEPETPGPISLNFEGDLVDILSLRAVQVEEFVFSFITTGDNDDSDCSHEDFDFLVTAPVVFP